VLAIVWLLSHAFVLGAAPVRLCLELSSRGADSVCTCSHGDGQECPMHHRAATPSSGCACRSTTDVATAALGSLLGPVALTSVSSEFDHFPRKGDLVVSALTFALDTITVPDAPPPRA
jgi:hypothetical protein